MDALIPDHTLFIQLGIFVASFLVLNQLVFKPYLKLLHAREAKTSGLKEQAIHQKERAEKLKVEYESFMKGERRKINEYVEAERRKIADEEREIISDARTTAANELLTVRKKNQGEFEDARRQLMPHVSEYASEIASKLVGKKVRVSAKENGSNLRVESEQTV